MAVPAGVNVLIIRQAVSIDAAAPDTVLPSPAAIASVALDGMDVAVLALFHDSGMVRNAISVPVEENDHSRLRGDTPFCPLIVLSEPRYAPFTS